MRKPVIPVEVPEAEQRLPIGEPMVYQGGPAPTSASAARSCLDDYAEKHLWDSMVQSLIAQQKEPVVVVTIANGVIRGRRKFFDTTPPVPTSPSQENNPTLEETLGALLQQSHCK